jgi:hypothetical protein
VLYPFVSVIDTTNVSEPIGHATTSSVKMSTGATVSTMIVVLLLADVFPARSVCSAVNVIGPSERAVKITDQFPDPSTTAL